MQNIYQKLAMLIEAHVPLQVKFIRLGEASCDAAYCIEKSKITFGFSTEKNLNFWNSLKVKNISDSEIGSELDRYKENISTGQRQTRQFFEDVGNTLWITRWNTKLYFGFSTSADANLSANGKTQREMGFGWHCEDVRGNILYVSELNGGITKTLSYRSTICSFSEQYANLLINRILNIPNFQRVEAQDAYKTLINKMEVLIKTFDPKDFELLVELIVSRAGLKRLGVAGKQEEKIDLVLSNPITDERWVVQVKSETKQQDFEEFKEGYKENLKTDISCKAIYAYHSGEIKRDSQDILLWDSKKMAQLTIDNGLVDWVIKVAPV